MLKSGEYTSEQILTLISGFKSKDMNVLDYLISNSIRDAIEKKTITYFILDKKETYIKFYFTIIAKPISLIGFDKETIKGLVNDSRQSVARSMLIAQLSKNSDDNKSLDVSPAIYWGYIESVINEQLDFRYPIIHLECKPELKKYYDEFGFIEILQNKPKDLITMYKPNRI